MKSFTLIQEEVIFFMVTILLAVHCNISLITGLLLLPLTSLSPLLFGFYTILITQNPIRDQIYYGSCQSLCHDPKSAKSVHRAMKLFVFLFCFFFVFFFFAAGMQFYEY